jgi:hypothetical protein
MVDNCHPAHGYRGTRTGPEEHWLAARIRARPAACPLRVSGGREHHPDLALEVNFGHSGEP